MRSKKSGRYTLCFKNRVCIGVSLCLLLALLLTACDLALPTQAGQPATPVVPRESAQDSTAGVTELQQYTSQDFGYSLSYPAGFEVESSFGHTVVFLAPPGTPGHRERASLAVELTFDQNAEWYANKAQEENANLGTGITFSVQVLDGQQAYIVGRLPGQDINRQVFIVKDGMLFHLRFAPDDPAAGEEYRQMEALYAAIMNSLRFLPQRRAVPPVTDMSNMVHQLEQALNARSADEISRLLGDEFVLGDLDPTTAEGVTFARHGRTEVIPLILDDYLSQVPAVALQYQVDWASIPGSLDTYSGILPNEVITPILARGWGANRADEAVILIARRSDGSLFWRGAFMLHGAT
jgi:hypothetical protein